MLTCSCTRYRENGCSMFLGRLSLQSGGLLHAATKPSTTTTLWPSGLRRWLKAPFRKGVGSNPTGVILKIVFRGLQVLAIACFSDGCIGASQVWLQRHSLASTSLQTSASTGHGMKSMISLGVWRHGSASDSRSEGWEFESLCPHFSLPLLPYARFPHDPWLGRLGGRMASSDPRTLGSLCASGHASDCARSQETSRRACLGAATSARASSNFTRPTPSPHRLVVRTSRCGRDNPGSTPGVDIFLSQAYGAMARVQVVARLALGARKLPLAQRVVRNGIMHKIACTSLHARVGGLGGNAQVGMCASMSQ